MPPLGTPARQGASPLDLMDASRSGARSARFARRFEPVGVGLLNFHFGIGVRPEGPQMGAFWYIDPWSQLKEWSDRHEN